ncbi:DUF4352 domain-containing protein [Virgibacillus soli]|uniref:DUF4352 domain-containing protein n=1 Tax=Paracerasibacillus soli TaxID=480284 RepID=UPI0035E55EB8
MMKKMSILLIMGLFLTACSGSDDGDKKDEPNNEQGASTSDKESSDDKNDSKEGNIYQIGDTAQTETSSLGYPYEVTVNSFDLTTDDIEGHSLEEYNYNPEEGGRFAVINVTIKNTGSESFIPNQQMSADLLFASTDGGDTDNNEDFFLEREQELKPGDEITGNLVFADSNYLSEEILYFVYERMSNEEIRFELPVPKE